MLGACWLTQTAISAQPEPAAVAAENRLIPYRAEYKVRRNGKKIGKLTATLSQDPNDDSLWRYRLESEATDWLVRLLGISTLEVAIFEIHDGRIRPLFYRMDSREPGSDRHWQHRYDWPNLQSSSDTHEGDLTIPLTPNTLDPLTLRLAMGMLASEPDAESWPFDIVERDEVERQFIRLIDRSRIEIGERCFDTIQFYRFRREGSSRNYYAWHAPALNGLPVKVRHDDDDHVIEMRLTNWQFDRNAFAASSEFNCN